MVKQNALEFPCSRLVFIIIQLLYPLLFIYFSFLPARASEQGNVIGSVRIYIYIYIYIYMCVCTKKNCN